MLLCWCSVGSLGWHDLLVFIYNREINIMILKRTLDDFGGGSGHSTFESDLFRVVQWRHHENKSTTIECKLIPFHDDIRFDGVETFKSDADCMEQFTVVEIVKMISCQKELSFKAGQQDKIEELKNCLKI